MSAAPDELDNIQADAGTWPSPTSASRLQHIVTRQRLATYSAEPLRARPLGPIPPPQARRRGSSTNRINRRIGLNTNRVNRRANVDRKFHRRRQPRHHCRDTTTI